MAPDRAADRRRLDAIRALGVLDRAGDPALTAFARLAAFVTGAAAAAVHILDDEAQRRIAADGAPLGDHPREDAMCRVVVDGEQRIVCADAVLEPRFSHSSFVRGDDPVRFYASLPLRTSDGTVIGTLCCWDTVVRELGDEQLARLEDLADQLIARIELTRVAIDLGHAASHDPLTGAVNRLVLADRLAQAFARRARHGGDVLVALADVDAFKGINDTFGHEAGDEVLVAVARRLREATRVEDTVARIGGDEFAVVAETAAGGGAAPLLDRVEAAMAEPIRFAGGLHRVGVTIGAAVAEPGDDVRAALARADRAMYERKAAGRRRTAPPTAAPRVRVALP